MYSYFVGTNGGTTVTLSTRYFPLDGVLTINATEASVQQVMPDTRDLDHWHIKVSAAPGAGHTVTFTLMDNGVATAMVVTISDTNTEGSYTGAAVTISAGHKVSVKVLLSASGTTQAPSWTMRQSGTGQAILFGSTSQITATNFYSPAGGQNGTTESNVGSPCPIAGTVTAIYAMADVNPTPGNWQVCVRTLGTTDSSATVNIPSGQAASTPVGLSGQSVSVAAGDLLSIHATAAASPGTSRISGGFVIVPTTAGLAAMLGSGGTAPGTGAANYLLPHGGRSGAVATSEVFSFPLTYMQALTIKALYVKLSTFPGATKSYDVTARLNSTTDTAATVNISGGSATTGNITGLNVAVADTDQLDIKDTPNGTPNAARIGTGIAYTLAGEIIVVPDAVAGAAAVSVTRVARTRQLWNTVG